LIDRLLKDGPPPEAPRPFRGYPGARYLPRLYSRAKGLPFADALGAAVADRLGLRNTEVLWFFAAFPTAEGFGRVLTAIEDGLEQEPPEGLGVVDPVHVLAARLRDEPDGPVARRCLDVIRSRLLSSGSAPEEVLRTSADCDRGWLSDHAPDLKRAAPGRGTAALRALERTGDGARALIAGLGLAEMEDPPLADLRAWLTLAPMLPEVHHVVAAALDGGQPAVVDVSSFDRALESPGDKVVAWNIDLWEGKDIVAVYGVGDGAPQRLAWRTYDPSEREQVSHGLRDRGFPVGDYDTESGFLWIGGAGADLVVWRGKEGRILHTDGEVLHHGSGRMLHRDAIVTVIAYAAEDYVDRGVRVQLRDGTAVAVVFDMNITPEALLGYSRNDLLFDASWTVHLGATLAGWAGTIFQDRL
jgi:hypothetical protein